MKYQMSDLLPDSKVFALKKRIHFLISNQLNIMGETNYSFASDLLEKAVLLLKYCM